MLRSCRSLALSAVSLRILLLIEVIIVAIRGRKAELAGTVSACSPMVVQSLFVHLRIFTGGALAVPSRAP
ncbi:hypothetical protein GCM10020258_51010 [Sphingomonas yabuuchiae]